MSRTITLQGFIILAIKGTEKLIVTEVDGRTEWWTVGQKFELLYRILLYNQHFM